MRDWRLSLLIWGSRNACRERHSTDQVRVVEQFSDIWKRIPCRFCMCTKTYLSKSPPLPRYDLQHSHSADVCFAFLACEVTCGSLVGTTWTRSTLWYIGTRTSDASIRGWPGTVFDKVSHIFLAISWSLLRQPLETLLSCRLILNLSPLPHSCLGGGKLRDRCRWLEQYKL